MSRLAILVLSCITWAPACDCTTPPVRIAKKHANVVFRGRITGFTHTALGEQVIFDVDRVWKGNVPRTFKMDAIREGAACIGFWPTLLETGKYLLVYAYRLGDAPDYVTDICSRTSLVDDSKDFIKLGKGHQPSPR